jgi:cell wall-associated NlpC family hydrolase
MLNLEYLDLIGMPFVRGGRGPVEWDCYGLLIEMFRRKGVILPDFTSPGTVEEVEAIMDREIGRWIIVPYGTPGACVRFRSSGCGAHVGFVLGNDKMIHASDTAGVCVERIADEVRKPLGFYDYV